jgi:hypothetical protein
MLTAFFDLNRNDPFAHDYTYQELSLNFVWDQQKKLWKCRQHGCTLGCLYFVSPTVGEHFYLRTLLTTVKGPTSWEELRMWEGICHPTFHAACLARGLLENDNEWHECLQEVSLTHLGESLRCLFSLILFLIDKDLQQHGASLLSFPSMPAVEHDWDAHNENPYIVEQLLYDHEEEHRCAENNIPLLNEEQSDAFNQIYCTH